MSSSEFSRLFDASPNWMILVDREGRLAAANRNARELFDLDPELSLETVWFPEFLESDDAELVRHELDAMAKMAQGKNRSVPQRSIEVRILKGKDQFLYVQVAISLLTPEVPNQPSESPTFMLVIHDISSSQEIIAELKKQNLKLTKELAKSSRKRREDARQADLSYQVLCEQIELARAEKELADSLGARWRSLTENAPQIVMLLDRKGKILFCNRQSSDDAPTSPKQTVQDFISSHDSLLTRRIVDEVLSTQESRAYDVGGEGANGMVLWHSISVGPIQTKTGKPSESVVLIATDITQRKLAEQAVARHQDELAHVSRLASMGALTVELAHELNQPLGVIGFYAGGCVVEMERDDWDRDRIVMAHNKILSETQRAAQITDAILDFLRRREAPRKMTEIDWLIRETLPLAELEAQKYRVPLRLELAAGSSDANVNRVQIQQVIINLISNAVHSVAASKPLKPEVCISTRIAEDRGIEVSVSDNGGGFDASTAEQLFEPLYTTKETGTGMGLSICRTLIELHGGRISASCRPNSGATFTFYLPHNESKYESGQMSSALIFDEIAEVR